MAYVSQEKKKELAPAIKALCKQYGVKATLAVRNHSTLVLNIKSAQIDFIKNYNETCEKNYRDGRNNKATTYLDVNTYHYDKQFSGKALQFITKAVDLMKGKDFFDESDYQTDYFHCSHYIDINVGQWDKPFIVE